MPRSKEIAGDLRKKIVETHEAGKGYKTISKMFNIPRSTVQQIIHRWKMFKTTATRPRSGRPTKLDVMVREVRRSGAGTQMGKVTTEDDEAQEEESECISGEDTIPGNPNVTVHTRAENTTKATTKRTRGHKEKTKDSDVIRNCVADPAEHSEEMILCCEICGACFPTEPDLESHQAQHLDKMLHQCQECGKSFQSSAGLRTHRSRKHGR